MKRDIQILTGQVLAADCRKTIAQATPRELYNAVSKAALDLAADAWKRAPGKRVAYLSAEFLVGRLVYANLLNMGRLGEVQQMLLDAGVDANVFEEIEDAALGNGGLGRLAACFLDSAATQGVPLDGYGIRYQYGLFRQYFEDGFQKETADDWQRFGDPWSVRREEDAVTVQFGGQAVRAVPYDTPVIGYGMKTVNTLRLWQAEPFQAFDFNLFNAQKYAAAVRERDAAEDISRVLYPNDDTDAGKRLRLKQQYFFSSASLQPMAGISPILPTHTRYSSTIPTPQWPFPSCCACWWKRRACVLPTQYRWPTIPLPTPTTPLCPRRWKNGIRSCSAACCPGCIRM